MNVDGTANDDAKKTDTTTVEIPLEDVSKVHTVTFTLTWTENNSTDENNADTTVGEAGSTITLPVTLTATQKV